MEVRRQHVCKEIVSSEEVYVQQMGAFINHLMKPVSEQLNFLGISQKQFESVFGGIDEIHRWHVRFLAELRACTSQAEMVKVFRQIAVGAEKNSVGRLYQRYINR